MIRSENPGSFKNLRSQLRVPIAAGEQWVSKWSFRQVIEEELIDYARIDLCIVGGITEAAKITHWAETHYIDIVPHNPLGPVSAAACVSLCMASTNVGVQEMPRRPGTNNTDLFPVQIGWEDGYAFCNDAPGLRHRNGHGRRGSQRWRPPRLVTPTPPQRRRVHELVITRFPALAEKCPRMTNGAKPRESLPRSDPYRSAMNPDASTSSSA